MEKTYKTITTPQGHCQNLLPISSCFLLQFYQTLSYHTEWFLSFSVIAYFGRKNTIQTMVLFHRMDNCNKYLFRAVILGMVQFVLCIILDIKVCKRWNGPTHHFSTSPDDFYRQNWPFLLLDTSLNVGLCQHFLSHNITRFTKYRV